MTKPNEICGSHAPTFVYYLMRNKTNEGRYNDSVKYFWCELETNHDGLCKCDEYEWVKEPVDEVF